MNALEALLELGATTINTRGNTSIEGKNFEFTNKRGIKLYNGKNDIFGMVGIELPDMISSKRDSRVQVKVPRNMQQSLLKMAEQAAKQFPRCLDKDVFDFALHAPLQVTERGLTVLPEGKWQLMPGLQFKMGHLSPNVSDVLSDDVGSVSLDLGRNIPHLMTFFLGSPRFSWSMNLNDEDRYQVDRSRVFNHWEDALRAIATSSNILQVGQKPHLPTVMARLEHLQDVLPEELTFDENTLLEFFDHYASIHANQYEEPEDSGW